MKIFAAVLATSYATPTCTNCAFVTNCDTNGLIDMQVKVLKSEVSQIPTGFADTAGDSYTASFGQADLEASFDADNLILTKTVAETYPVTLDGQTVYKATGHTLDFVCTYPLDDRTVRDNYDVTGQNVDEFAENTGTLGYDLEMVQKDGADLHKIGSTAEFTITPKNPGLVWAAVKSCQVKRGTNAVQIIGDGGDMCTNGYLSVALTTWTSKTGNLEVKYQLKIPLNF